MNLRLALLALPLALAGCDEQSMADLRMPWDRPEPVVEAPAEPGPPTIPPPPQVSPVDQPLEIGAPGALRATGERETYQLTEVAASGEGWSVEVAEGRARFTRPGANPATVPVRRIVYAGGIEFVGELNGRVFAMTITPVDCGRQPLTALLRANGNRYAGCAAPGALPAATETAAAAAPAAG